MRKLLIKLLGGHTSQELAFLKTEFEKTKLECDEYIIFVNSVCNYVGSYPVWKAQQEYRELMYELGNPILSEIKGFPTHSQNVDIYLGKVVDSCVDLFKKVDFECGSSHWWEKEFLSTARGDNYLDKITGVKK